MSGHTAGPWELDRSRRVLGKAFDGSCKSIVDQVRGASPEEADANARLIVAAPDMLAGLRAAEHALRSYQYGNIATELAEEVADKCANILAMILPPKTPGTGQLTERDKPLFYDAIQGNLDLERDDGGHPVARRPNKPQGSA